MNDWVNNREAGDLRRQHGHYDVIVMVEVTSHYLKQLWLVYWRIYASLGLNELKPKQSFGSKQLGLAVYEKLRWHKHVEYFAQT